MATLQKIILNDHPIGIITAVTFLLALISLNGTPSFSPLVFLLTTIHLYIHIICKQDAFVWRLLTIWFIIALAGTLANLSTAMHALSTLLISFVMLACMSLVESAFPLIVIIVDATLRGRMQTPWAQIVLFPVLWATVWTGIAHINP